MASLTAFATKEENESWIAGYHYEFYGTHVNKTVICGTPARQRAYDLGRKAAQEEKESNDFYFGEG